VVYTAMTAKHSFDLSYIIGFFIHRIIRLVVIFIDWLNFLK